SVKQVNSKNILPLILDVVTRPEEPRIDINDKSDVEKENKVTNMENKEGNLLNLEKRDSKYKQLTKEQRQGILEKLLQQMNDKTKTQYRKGKICADVSSKKKKICGRKPKEYSSKLAQIKNTPLNRRRTPRSLSFAIDILKSTLFDIFNFNNKNKMDRLKFCSSKVNLANNGDLLFDNLYDYVHIDEKWYYLTIVKRSFYLMLNQEKRRETAKVRDLLRK
ncbi:hypothetical protein CWI36_1771p0010, partial [Hamiltosporidium magnivora]